LSKKIKLLSRLQMKQKIATLSLLVRDYDEAIAFYTQKLGFILLEDTDLGDGKRWVRVVPRGATETSLLLAMISGATTTR
jgi:catechol 2,3-dioxygenase-like lactoylglutathione lyase family enzyme